MSLELLQSSIKEGIKTSKGTEYGRYRHLNASLNNLLKKGILSSDNILIGLGADLKKTQDAFEEVTILQGNSLDRSSRTRIKNLAEYYSKITNIDTKETTFTELLLAAVARKYGEKLWTGQLTKYTTRKINAKYITYVAVAKEIIVASCSEDPTLWENASLDNNESILASAKTIVLYLSDDIVPSIRTSNERIHFIEHFLHLPHGSLLSKLDRFTSHDKSPKKNGEKSLSHVNKTKTEHKELNKKLQMLCDEYSDFKMNSTLLEGRNISDELKASKHFEIRSVVKEKNRKNSKGWTLNNKFQCNSQRLFHSNLLSFFNYCILELNMGFDEVGSEHLCSPDLLFKLANFGEKKQTGASWIVNILQFVNRGAQSRGYLRFCGDRGDCNTVKDHYDSMDVIRDFCDDWMIDAAKGVGKMPKGIRGKKSIQFLLNMEIEERKRVMYEATLFILKSAEKCKKEWARRLKLAKNSTLSKSVKHMNVARTNITKAYKLAYTALIQELSSIHCPRVSTWSAMKYYPSMAENDNSFSSLTYLRQRNQFKLYIPIQGSLLVDVDDDEASQIKYRVLKNSNSPSTVEVNHYIPLRLTSLIKLFLEYRKNYINIAISRVDGVADESIDLLLPLHCNDIENIKNDHDKIIRRAYLQPESSLSITFKNNTRSAYKEVAPDEKQNGINHHSMRHLVVDTYQREHPGDKTGAAALINDSPEQITDTYGDNNREEGISRVFKYGETGNTFE